MHKGKESIKIVIRKILLTGMTGAVLISSGCANTKPELFMTT